MGRRAETKRAVTTTKETTTTSPSPTRRPALRGRNGPRTSGGCPIPEPLSCMVGCTLDENEEGRKLNCTNTSCPYNNTLVHDRCLDAFEEHLVKILQSSGSARGWTDGQRRQNLWEKKGQALVGKVCRCRCGLGLVIRDERHDIARAIREKQQVEAQKGIKKKRVKKESALPRLNYGTKGQTLFPEPKHKSRTRYTSESESEISSYASENIQSRRESMSANNNNNDCWGVAASRNKSGFHDSVDEPDTSYPALDSEYKFYTPPPSATLKRSHTPTSALYKKSFADAIQRPNSGTNGRISPATSRKNSASTLDRSALHLPLTVQTENIGPALLRKGMRNSNGGGDSGIEMKSGAASLSDGDAGTPPLESVLNSPQNYIPSSMLPETPCTTRSGRWSQAVTAGRQTGSRKNSPSSQYSAQRSQPLVPGGTPAWRPPTPSLPAISPNAGFSFEKKESFDSLEELMKSFAGVGFKTGLGSSSFEQKNVNSDPPPGLTLNRRPSIEHSRSLNAIPSLMSLPVSPPPQLFERCPTTSYVLKHDATPSPLHSPNTDFKSPVDKFTNKNSSSSTHARSSGRKHSESMKRELSTPSPTPKPNATKVSISKKITGGGSHLVPAASTNNSKFANRQPAQSEEEKRPVTPINWEDELPPELNKKDFTASYGLFGQSSFFLGETILGQVALPGYW